MRTLVILLLASAGATACRRVEEREHHVDQYDEAKVQEIIAQYEVYDDMGVPASETVEEDGSDCEVSKWFLMPFYTYDPNNMTGMGFHMKDRSYPIEQLEEERVRMLLYEVFPDGSYDLAGLEWYYEPPDQVAEDEVPTLFGIPLDGMMDPHDPYQGMHYDIHAWFWYPDESLEKTYFGQFNPQLHAPDWWFEAEQNMVDMIWFWYPAYQWPEMGFTEPTGECIRGTDGTGDVGIPWTQEHLIGQLDPIMPDTLLADVNGLPLAVQWTYPDDGTGIPPQMFGQDFSGPDENGNYYFRWWAGWRANPNGLFADTHRAFSCDEPTTPEVCWPTPI